jgi:hypothetical protein
VLAVIAITISGGTLLWTVSWSLAQWRWTRPRLTVRCVWAFLAFPGTGEEGPPDGDEHRLAPVTLDSSSLLIRGRRRARLAPLAWVVERHAPLPLRLEPGAHWMGMAEGLRRR